MGEILDPQDYTYVVYDIPIDTEEFVKIKISKINYKELGDEIDNLDILEPVEVKDLLEKSLFEDYNIVINQ